MGRINPIAFFWILALFSALLLLAPIRTGDLAGYDDALHAHIAKHIALSGDWLHPQSNGHPEFEHPPLFHWTEALTFRAFGISDPIAKLPSALSGLGAILLCFWVTRRLLGPGYEAPAAMLMMATSFYFLKYASRPMTDVFCTFLFLASVSAWVAAENDRRWYVAAGLFAGLCLLSRGLVGLALPAIFLLHAIGTRRRVPLRYSLAVLVLTLMPVSAWYAWQLHSGGAAFVSSHEHFLQDSIYGGLKPAWRRYTGAPEYLWMVAKSYWPWFPLLVAGIVFTVRGKDRRALLPLIWIVIVFAMCSVARARVLRYMLPAYPAFAVMAAFGAGRLVSRETLKRGLLILTPLFAIASLWVAIKPPVAWHAIEAKSLAPILDAATPTDARIAFFDEGVMRFDETNQLQWYSTRVFDILDSPDALRSQRETLLLIDRASYRTYVESEMPHQVLAESGHLLCVRLLGVKPF